MPLYEYRCTNCGELTEILQKHSDASAKICPHCHKNHLIKQISSTYFQLKGGGWYVTDFKNKKENKNKPAEIEKTTTEKTDTTKATDTKTPEKTEKSETTEKTKVIETKKTAKTE